ncbi:MAG: hypothetical protein AB1592_17670 [Pseudomonadota bacterium]
MTPSTRTPVNDFAIAAQNPSLIAWCRLAAPEELEFFSAHERAGSDFAKLMAGHGIRPVMFIRTFEGVEGVHRTPVWLAGDLPCADDLQALRFLDRMDPREVVNIATRQSLQFETFLRWHHKRPEKLKHWLAN